VIQGMMKFAGTIFTKALFKKKLNLRSGMQVSTNMQAAIPLGTALRRGYLKTAMTFVRFKLYWGMLMSRQRRSILMW